MLAYGKHQDLPLRKKEHFAMSNQWGAFINQAYYYATI
jgi:hypothetical protein